MERRIYLRIYLALTTKDYKENSVAANQSTATFPCLSTASFSFRSGLKITSRMQQRTVLSAAEDSSVLVAKLLETQTEPVSLHTAAKAKEFQFSDFIWKSKESFRDFLKFPAVP